MMSLSIRLFCLTTIAFFFMVIFFFCSLPFLRDVFFGFFLWRRFGCDRFLAFGIAADWLVCRLILPNVRIKSVVNEFYNKQNVTYDLTMSNMDATTLFSAQYDPIYFIWFLAQFDDRIEDENQSILCASFRRLVSALLFALAWIFIFMYIYEYDNIENMHNQTHKACYDRSADYLSVSAE